MFRYLGLQGYLIQTHSGRALACIVCVGFNSQPRKESMRKEKKTGESRKREGEEEMEGKGETRKQGRKREEKGKISQPGF